MHCKKLVSMSLSSLAVVFVSFLLTMFTMGTTYALNHSSNITSSETWAAADNPHIVTTSIHVYNSATLTIEPGCLVKFDSAVALYIGYYSAATLNAVGTSINPITFTSNAGTPEPGDWQGIFFYNSTDDAATIMDYCTVEYGGASGESFNIYCNFASPTIQNCTIRHSDGYGIYCDNYSAPTLTNNTISNNGSYPISEYSNLLDSNVSGNTGSGNVPNAIEVRGGAIFSSHTWIPQDFYFNVISPIHVYNTATLTIEPGCLVKFDAGAGLYIGYYSAATLNAVGTSINPITFTSNAGTPAPGDWLGIVFFNSTVDAATIMDYCTVEYGGYGGYDSNIYCESASPTIQNCTMQYSDGYGIFCDNNSAPTLTNNTISNNGSYPISEYCDRLDSNVTGNTGSSNVPDAIEVRGGTIISVSSYTWIPQDFYFNVTSTIHVYNGATLTIPPGCLVKFDSGTALYIGFYSAATLNAAGTSVNPITFTSNESTPAPGDWGGILFYNSTDDAATIMDYCTVEYGGASDENSNIYCNSASPTIQNCTIQQSDGFGVYCDNNSAPTLTNNTISNNGSYPISAFCNILDSNVTGNTGNSNVPDAIEVRGGIIISVSSHTWIPQDFYFNVTSTIHVYNGATLTIPPGCLVKFNSGTDFYIGYYSAATLNAVGTSVNPITFTSNESTPAPGDWSGVLFYNSTDDAATIMDYCTVEYGGASSENSNINCTNASPTIQHCIIRNSDGFGIYTLGSGAAPLISCSALTNNNYGVYVNDSADPTVVDCRITGNTSYGIYSEFSSITIDAENNWWGSADGPNGVGSGSGDAVSDFVDFTPFRTAFDSCLETIVLSPADATNFVGSQHTVTATVEDESAEPIEGIEVSFDITFGPHLGGNGTDKTDSNGQATFTYTGTSEGDDTIEGSFVDFHGRTITSNGVTKTWEAPATPIPTPSPSPTPTPSCPPNPVLGSQACYPLDEGSGNIAGDASGNGNDGNIIGADWTTGKICGGLSFDGVDDYVTIPIMNSDEVSVCAWFYKNAVDTEHYDGIFGGYYWDMDIQLREGFCLKFYPSDPHILRFILVTQDAAGNRVQKTVRFDLGNSVSNWYHVVGTYEQATGKQKLFVNGALVNSRKHPTGNTVVPLTLHTEMLIGQSGPKGYFDGTIDEVCLYNRALSDQEVLDIYNQ